MICSLSSERDELSPFFNFLFTYTFIFNYISLLFHLFSFIYRVFYNLMVTTACILLLFSI